MEELNRLFEEARSMNDIDGDEIVNIFDKMHDEKISDEEAQIIHEKVKSKVEEGKEQTMDYLQTIRHTLLLHSQRNFLKMMFSNCSLEEQLDCALKITQLLKLMREEEE